MVSVTPVNDLSARSCNCCTEKADIEIHFANWNNTRDSVIVLCNRCASDLKRRLRDDTLEPCNREDHLDVSVDFGFTCEVCALFKHNFNSVFETGCEGDSEICERFDPLD